MDQDLLRKQFQIHRLIWIAMFASLGVYLAVYFMVGESVRAQQTGEMPLDTFRNILLAVAAGEVLLIGFIRKRLLTPAPEMKGKAALPIQRYFVTGIITYALAESIGIFGLVLYFLGDSVDYLYLFICVSAGVMLYYRPTFPAFAEWVTTAAGPV